MRCRWGSGRVRGDRGAQAVEFALLWVFALVPLILGMIEFGAVMYSQITITQSAREAARHLALNLTGHDEAACGSDATCDAKAVASDAAAPLTLDGTSTYTACPVGAIQTTAATVTISASALLPLLFHVTVTGKASMPCGG